MSFHLESPAFAAGGIIPREHTEDGADRSPELKWTGSPTGTVELALIVDDPDAPVAEPWVHWLIWKIPATWNELPPGFHGRTMPENCQGLRQGLNTWGTVGWRGPAPPRGRGPHHYHFKLVALGAAIELPDGSRKRDLLAALKHHELGRAELVGVYERR